MIGFDIERHDYGTGGYPGELVLQDVLTLDGSCFRDAAVIVASPPCQEYSYMAMPWSRAKAIAADYRSGVRDVKKLTALFDACFRIAREAGVPVIVENVRGAQPWVGRSRWHYGSFHLWGDVPALMPMRSAIKNNGGSWFNIAHNTTSGVGQNPDGRKVPGMNFHDHEKTGQPGRSFQSAAVEAIKVGGDRFGSGEDCSPMRRCSSRPAKDGVKQAGISGPRTNGKGDAWFQDGAATFGSRSTSRKAASAQIAKIPFPLAQHIARCFDPRSK